MGDPEDAPQGLAINILFLEELSDQVGLFEGALDKFKKEVEGSSEELMRISHSIKGAGKLVMQTPVIDLASALERYFHSIEKERVSVEDDVLSLLDSYLGVLRDFSRSSPSTMAQEIAARKARVAELIPRLDRLIKAKAVEQLGEVASAPLDPGAGELLSRAILNPVVFMKESLPNLVENSVDGGQWNKLVEAASHIKHATKKAPWKSLESLAGALENCFLAGGHDQLVWTQGHLDLVSEAINTFAAIIEIPSKGLHEWMGKHTKDIEAIAGILDVISKESMVALSPTKKESIGIFDLESPMFELFASEAESQAQLLTDELLALEANPKNLKHVDHLMRAAHSLKGATRVVDLAVVSTLAHVVEDYFIAVKSGIAAINSENIDVIFKAVDFIVKLSRQRQGNVQAWIQQQMDLLKGLIDEVSRLVNPEQNKEGKQEQITSIPAQRISYQGRRQEPVDKHHFKVSARNLSNLMGLAGEALVETNWLKPFTDSLFQLKRCHSNISNLLDRVQESLPRGYRNNDLIGKYLTAAKVSFFDYNCALAEKLTELDMFSRRHSNLADRLYGEVMTTRMRPFADGVEGFKRMVRDLSRELEKKVRLEIKGKETLVDREILELLEAPLTHLIRNAIDHGIELPEERLLKGMAAEGVVTLEASQQAGMLSLIVKDDGVGIDQECLRRDIVKKNLASEEMAAKMTESELLEFIFLPGYSTAEIVTEISGRGVGLNIVQNMVREVGGNVSVFSDGGLSFLLQLPLTLSVMRSLLVEISGGTYALPLARIEQVLVLDKSKLDVIEQRHYFHLDNRNIGVVYASQFLELPARKSEGNEISILVIRDVVNEYGIVVDRFIGEKELVIQEFDVSIGKVPDVSAASILEDGSPVIILDIDDIIVSIDKMLASGAGEEWAVDLPGEEKGPKKRILVIDDSLTVREVESRLLTNKGYIVDTAVNGMDGWNAVKFGNYDLVVTDVDMPRMDGIELVKNLRGDPALKEIPVVIVSYKEREEDKARGLNAGANYYLTKSSFHDQTLLRAVEDLIGEP